MMSVRWRSSGPSRRRFAQQLSGVAHRAHRVADLVRDARAQPPERGELRLLHALGHHAGVLEEHQHRPRPGLGQRHEMRADHGAAVGGDDLTRRVAPVVILLAPGLEQVQQARGDLAQQRAALHRPALQHPRRRLVDEPHAVRAVDHEDALAQVLHDELVQLVQVREVDVALLHARLALPQLVRQRDREQRDREQARAGEARHQEVRALADAGEGRDRGFEQQRQRDQGSGEKREAWLHDRGRRAGGQDQQRCESAVHAAARMDEQRDRDGVDRELEQRGPLRRRPAALDRLDRHQPEAEMRDADAEEEPGIGGPDAARGRIEEEHQDQHHRHQQPEDVEQADDAPREIGGDGRGRAGAGAGVLGHSPQFVVSRLLRQYGEGRRALPALARRSAERVNYAALSPAPGRVA